VAEKKIPAAAAGDTGEEDAGKADAEAEAIASGKLKQQAEKNAHTRTQNFLDSLNWCVLSFLRLGFAIVSIAVITWAWHFLTPTGWHYLTAAQLDKLQTVLFTGAFASILQAYAKKHMS